MTNLLLEMDDKLDSVAYGSHLVDVGEQGLPVRVIDRLLTADM